MPVPKGADRLDTVRVQFFDNVPPPVSGGGLLYS
jgi:hypothetical protein